MSRPKQKKVLLLVEGSSDMTALWIELSKLFEQYDPSITLECRHPRDDGRSHDVTVESFDDVEKIQGVINKVFLSEYIEKEHLYPKDIDEVIQIVDMDGAYVSDECIIQDSVEKPYYSQNVIRTKDPEALRRVHHTKVRNLDYLSSLKKIDVYSGDGKSSSKARPYSVYYFSSNLDHVIHGDANLEGRLKGEKAREFRSHCSEDEDYFVQFFFRDKIAQDNLSYDESWDYIKNEIIHLNRIQIYMY